MSLSKIIHQLIESQGEISLNELEEICHQEHYKLSNAERRARELMANKLISPIKNSKGAIIGYKKFEETEQSILL